MSSTLLLTFNFPPHTGGIARMIGELALRYAPHTPFVSTGAYTDSAGSDVRFPQVIARVGIRATRLRTPLRRRMGAAGRRRWRRTTIGTG